MAKSPANTSPPASRETLSALGVRALDYAERLHWPVFPIVPGEKTPLTAGSFADATTDPAKITKWWKKWPDANIGFSPGDAGMFALDLDPGSDIFALDKLVGGLPATKLVQITPRGGSHLFFALGEGEIVAPSVAKAGGIERFGPHIDVRSTNSYVLLAPSVTADGTYSWESTGRPAYRTDEMRRLASIGAQKSKDRDEWLIPADLPENVTLATAWLRDKAKPAIKIGHVAPDGTIGGGGNDMAYATAAMCKSYGLSEAMALDLMLEHWAPRCTPHWYDPANLEAITEHAYRYNTSPPGAETPAYRKAKSASLFSVQQLGGDAPEWPEGLFDGPEIADRPPARWIIRDVLQERSYSNASGRTGAGKSFNELALALPIALGGTWLGMPIETTGPVLYVAAEDGERIWKDVCGWCAEFKIEPASLRGKFFIFDRSARLNTDDGKAALEKILVAIMHRTGRLPIYAVFDTLVRNMRGGVSQEEPTGEVLHRIGELKTLGIAVTLVAHHGRSHGETKGLTEWEDSADFVRHYTGSVRNSDTVITFAKIKGAPDGWEMAVKYTTHQLPGGESTKVAASATRKGHEPPAPSKPKDEAKALMLASVTDKIVDNAIREELENIKSGAYSEKTLIQILVQREDIETTEANLRTHVLPRLCRTKDTYASKARHPKAKPAVRWRYFTEEK